MAEDTPSARSEKERAPTVGHHEELLERARPVLESLRGRVRMSEQFREESQRRLDAGAVDDPDELRQRMEGSRLGAEDVQATANLVSDLVNALTESEAALVSVQGERDALAERLEAVERESAECHDCGQTKPIFLWLEVTLGVCDECMADRYTVAQRIMAEMEAGIRRDDEVVALTEQVEALRAFADEVAGLDPENFRLDTPGFVVGYFKAKAVAALEGVPSAAATRREEALREAGRDLVEVASDRREGIAEGVAHTVIPWSFFEAFRAALATTPEPPPTQPIPVPGDGLPNPLITDPPDLVPTPVNVPPPEVVSCPRCEADNDPKYGTCWNCDLVVATPFPRDLLIPCLGEPWFPSVTPAAPPSSREDDAPTCKRQRVRLPSSTDDDVVACGAPAAYEVFSTSGEWKPWCKACVVGQGITDKSRVRSLPGTEAPHA